MKSSLKNATYDNIETDDDNAFIIEGPEPESDLSYKYIEMNADLQYIEQGVDVKEFRENMNKRNLKLEFDILRKLTESPVHTVLLREYNPELTKMNRYSTIRPCLLQFNKNEHTQVTIPSRSSESKEVETYINASYISSSKKSDQKAFIATQGPLDATKGHFWRMIWAEKTTLIIMLCQFKENGKQQCDMYWGDKHGNELELDDIRISIVSCQEYPDSNFKQRTIKLEKDGETRIIEHYNWTGWPDHGVPGSEEFVNISKLIDLIHEERSKNQSPIVIHCSAGIGRTGTLLAMYNVDYLLRTFFANKAENIRVSIFGIVRRLREQRWGMVNTKDQYQLIYNYTCELIDKYLREYNQ